MTVRQRVLVSILATQMTLVAACDSDLTVSTPSNHAPVFWDIPDTSISLDGTLELSFSATDQDGDSLTYRLTNILSFQELREGYAPNAQIDADLRLFRFTPVERDAPARSFRITARDGHGEADSTTFSVAIE